MNTASGAVTGETCLKRPQSELTFRPLEPEDGTELLALLAEADFLPDTFPQEALARLLEGSAVQFGAFADGRLVGFGRALSDGSSDAYLQDVAVRSDCRRRGIGAALVKRIVAELTARGVDWIGLVAVPEAEAFYRRIGFVPMKDHVPMKLAPASPGKSADAD